eukprot:763714-Hanusia_phi.AAC.5
MLSRRTSRDLTASFPFCLYSKKSCSFLERVSVMPADAALAAQMPSLPQPAILPPAFSWPLPSNGQRLDARPGQAWLLPLPWLSSEVDLPEL